ncbi:hypothetical protein PAMC26577_38640 [Caballeronia sordidicola]|uniref:Uncharacterized protein n=1 Tax=Caballeronia sordidicola TaxID=196367 RepID=A0A242M5T1_CABSO|nr:hypothetical protein PAMC26577_38640 [Caballeronia sordidicola]
MFRGLFSFRAAFFTSLVFDGVLFSELLHLRLRALQHILGRTHVNVVA